MADIRTVSTSITKYSCASITTNHRPFLKTSQPEMIRVGGSHFLLKRINDDSVLNMSHGMFEIDPVRNASNSEILVMADDPRIGSRRFCVLRPRKMLINDFIPGSLMDFPSWLFGYRHRFINVREAHQVPELDIMFVLSKPQAEGFLAEVLRSTAFLHDLVMALMGPEYYQRGIKDIFRCGDKVDIFRVSALYPGPTKKPSEVPKFLLLEE